MDRENLLRPRILLLLSLLTAATAFLYTTRILQPWTRSMDAQRGVLTATLGDFYPHWAGTRALLVEGKNPYGADVSHAIQTAYYGRPIFQNYDVPKSEIIDEQRFAYPVYVAFLIAPSAYLTYAVAHALMRWLLLVLVVASIQLWLGVLRWRPGALITSTVTVFILACPQIVQGLERVQLGLLVGFLLALGAWCTTRDHLAAGGAVLALATIKPQMSVLPIAWFLVWGLGDLPKRWQLLVGFLGTLALMICAGEWILPGWIGDFVHGLVVYRKYVVSPPLLELAVGKTLGWPASAIVVIAAIGYAWMNRKSTCGSAEFASTLSALLIATSLAVPVFAPFNQVLLILPVLIIVRDWCSLRSASRLAFLACISWPWVTEILLFALSPNTRSRWPLLPLPPVLLLPFLVPLILTTGRRRIVAATSGLTPVNI